ncbi:MAG TPA: diguanylate cyclase, partial [Bacilli bacterium]|nr:diguanylate cyclase [Bacilli bacterium]
MLSNVNFSPGIYVLFTVIVIIVTVAVTLYLGYRVIQERRHYREEAFTLIDGLLTKSEIYTSITSYLSKAPKDTLFALYLIDLDKFSDVVNAFGQKQSEKILEKITQRIIPLLPKRTQIARV